MTCSSSLAKRRYSIEPRTRKYVTGLGFLSFSRKYKKIVKQEPVEAIIIPPEERDEILNKLRQVFTAWKVSKYGVISGPYFPVFVLNTENPNTGKYRPEITPYLDTFDVVIVIKMEHYKISKLLNYSTVSKFVTKMDQSKWFIKPISC